ncbi:MCE family protein [Rhodococcus triatomae]|uniref:Virulence factor Mce family protein n=1 Tax=Rhodococcus triatomae TaxID=300028 RepID=A0A1G8B844_9NOCA|nr:MCE family protein [Rhodococcus triatomae]QNG17544.1 MCE family protein [Rhodococcus triatomae]QNG22788.1 MCE family protein [Rhodococcus triatomae]SDH29422.1 virulence factor Mce family protein [Rhodococcus triatomae]
MGETTVGLYDDTTTGRRRVLGVVFVLVLGLFVYGTVSIYARTFERVVTVSLVTDTVGNSLPQNADVKVRGLIVGQVRSSHTDGVQVTSELALDPDKAALIPSDTTARLLPKTLFGERYVSLTIPRTTAAEPVHDGDTIRQDASGNAIEVGRVLDGLLPLLRAVPPESLSSTLGALSQGLAGRGTELGFTLDRLEEIFGAVTDELPNLQAGLRGLADFSRTYADAAPDLVNALDNLRVTGNTVVERRNELVALLASATATSGSTADLLAANADAVITISADSREALQILGRYSPSLGCILGGFARTAPDAREVMAADNPHPGVRANIQLVNPKGRYLPNQDEPRMRDDRGPSCEDSYKEADRPFPQYPGGTSRNDGAYPVPSRNPGSSRPLEIFPAPEGVPNVVPRWTGAQASYVGSKAEQDTLDVVYGEANGLAPEDVPGWTTTLGAPALRGADVSIR